MVINDISNPTGFIADFVVRTSYQDLPETAIKNAKRSILDGIAACLAGSKSPVSKLIADYVFEKCCKPEATVIPYGFKTAITEAALANGTIMHAVDYDDVAEAFSGHPTTVILPAVLALGEYYGASGKEVILAYVVSYEIGNKIGAGMGSSHYNKGWHGTVTIGTMAAVVAAAKILKLDIKITRTAMGIAASLASGLRQNFGTMTKPLHAGHAANNGVFAALLAQKGITSDLGIIEGRFGYANVFGGDIKPDLKKMTQSLGDPFEIDQTAPIIKLYPSCRATAGGIDATLSIVKDNNIDVNDIAEIECRTSPHTPTVLIHSRPWTALEAKFSLEYCVAIALLDKKVGLNQFTDQKVQSPVIQQLIKKVRYVHPPEMGSGVGDSMRGPVEIVVRMKDGKELPCSIEVAKGDPENPLTEKEMELKFLDCAQIVFSEDHAVQIFDNISRLEQIRDISSLISLIKSPDPK